MVRKHIINISESELREEYCVKHKTAQEIANMYSVDKSTILSRMEFLGIPRRTSGESQKGKHISNEHIAAIVKAHLNKKLSDDTKQKIGKHQPNYIELPSREVLEEQYCVLNKTILEIANEFSVSGTTASRWLNKLNIVRRNAGNKKGHITPRETKEKIAASVTNFWNTESYRRECALRKISEANKNKVLSEETKHKIAIKTIGHTVSDESRQKIREKNIGKKHSIVVCNKISISRKKYIVEHPEIIDKMRVSSIEKMRDSNYRKRVFGFRSVKGMNKEEAKLFNILNLLNTNFCYTGNFTFWLGNKNPDFVDFKNKLIIEMWGDFYHRGQSPQARIDYFKQFGYKTLIIWTSELKESSMLDIIISFSS